MILTLRQSKALRKACLKNSKSHLRLARSMLKRRKWNIATFLAITSIEESQKVSLLNFLESNQLTEKDFNKYWTHHQSKLRTKDAAIAIYVDLGKKIPEARLVLGQKSKADETIQIRENSLYVDFLPTGEVVEPTAINAAFATQYCNDAHSELQSALALEELSRRMKKHFKLIKNQKIVKLKPIQIS